MDVPRNILCLLLVILLTLPHVFCGPVSKISESGIIKALSSNANEKSNFPQGHKVQRRSPYQIKNMVASESRYLLHPFLPYPNYAREPYPRQYTSVFGSNYNHLRGNFGSYSHQHHHVNHDYKGDRHQYFHNHHDFPHDHHSCNFDGSGESGHSGEGRIYPTLPYPGKYTPRPAKPSKATPKMDTGVTTVDPTYDIDVRLGSAGTQSKN